MEAVEMEPEGQTTPLRSLAEEGRKETGSPLCMWWQQSDVDTGEPLRVDETGPGRGGAL